MQGYRETAVVGHILQEPIDVSKGECFRSLGTAYRDAFVGAGEEPNAIIYRAARGNRKSRARYLLYNFGRNDLLRRRRVCSVVEKSLQPDSL